MDQASKIQKAGNEGIGQAGSAKGLASPTGLQKAQEEIKGAVEKDAKAIDAMKDGGPGAGAIATAIGEAQGWIHSAISEHSKTIEEAGDKDAKQKMIEDLASGMRHKIMAYLNTNDPSGVRAKITSEASNLVGDSFSATGIIGSIDPKNAQILDIIKKKMPLGTAKEVKDNARQIAYATVNIKEVKAQIETAINGSNISFGLMRATMRYILIHKAGEIAAALKGTNPNTAGTIAGYIKGELNTGTAEKTIAKAMFAVVISEIIRNNAEQISGQKTYKDLQQQIADKVTQEIKK